MPGTPGLECFRAFIHAPREAFEQFCCDGVYSREPRYRLSEIPVWTFHSVDQVFRIDNCDALKPEWIRMAEVMSEETFWSELQQHNGVSRAIKDAIKENLLNQTLGRFADAEVAESVQRHPIRSLRVTSGMVAPPVNLGSNKVAGLLGYLAGRVGDAEIDKEFLDRMQEVQSDIYYVTGLPRHQGGLPRRQVTLS